MPDTTTAPDLYPDRPQTFHGRGVWELGEDGEWGIFVEGHGPEALEALHAQLRDAQGSYYDPTDVDGAVEKWVRFIETCGCTETQHAQHERDNANPDYSGPLCGDGDLCKRSGLPPCQPDRYAWAWETVDEGDEGALPVLEVRW